MGTTTSCHECKCDDRCPTPNGSPTKMTRFTFEEEICNPGEKCKSWAQSPIKSIALLEQRCAIHLPSGCRKTKSSKGRKGIDDEKHLHFSFSSGDHFGLHLEEIVNEIARLTLASLLVVVGVDAASAFATTKDGRDGVCAGDVIVEVNGRRGTAEQIRQVLEEAVTYGMCNGIRLVVRPRPPTFYVEIPCDDPSRKRLGMTAVIDKTNPDCVLVKALRREGMVPDWNSTHGSLQICSGDLIIEVNGISQDAPAMCRAMQDLRKGFPICFRIMTLRSYGSQQNSNEKLEAAEMSSEDWFSQSLTSHSAFHSQHYPELEFEAPWVHDDFSQIVGGSISAHSRPTKPRKRKKVKGEVTIDSDSETEVEISVFLGTPSKHET